MAFPVGRGPAEPYPAQERTLQPLYPVIVNEPVVFSESRSPGALQLVGVFLVHAKKHVHAQPDPSGAEPGAEFANIFQQLVEASVADGVQAHGRSLFVFFIHGIVEEACHSRTGAAKVLILVNGSAHGIGEFKQLVRYP